MAAVAGVAGAVAGAGVAAGAVVLEDDVVLEDAVLLPDDGAGGAKFPGDSQVLTYFLVLV
jgi:hypothetical protein